MRIGNNKMNSINDIKNEKHFLDIFRGGPGKHNISGRENPYLEINTLEVNIRKEFLKNIQCPTFLSKLFYLKKNLIYNFILIKKEEIKKNIWNYLEKIIDNLNDDDVINIHKNININLFNDQKNFLNYLDNFRNAKHKHEHKHEHKHGHKHAHKRAHKHGHNDQRKNEWGRKNILWSALPGNINLKKLLWNNINISNYDQINFVRINEKVNIFWKIYLTYNLLNSYKCKHKGFIDDVLQILVKREIEHIEHIEGVKKIQFCNIFHMGGKQIQDDEGKEKGCENEEKDKEKGPEIGPEKDPETGHEKDKDEHVSTCIPSEGAVKESQQSNQINNTDNLNDTQVNSQGEGDLPHLPLLPLHPHLPLHPLHPLHHPPPPVGHCLKVKQLSDTEDLVRSNHDSKICVSKNTTRKIVPISPSSPTSPVLPMSPTSAESYISPTSHASTTSPTSIYSRRPHGAITKMKKEIYRKAKLKNLRSTEVGKENSYVHELVVNSIRGETRIKVKNLVKIHQVGQGAYGDVWMAQDVTHNKRVALKKLKLNGSKEGLAKTYIREISLLNSLKHENIVELIGVVHTRLPSQGDDANMNKKSIGRKGQKLLLDRLDRVLPTAPHTRASGESPIEWSSNSEIDGSDGSDGSDESDGSDGSDESDESSESDGSDESSESSDDGNDSGGSAASNSSGAYAAQVAGNRTTPMQGSKTSIWMIFEYVPFDLSGYSELLREKRAQRERYKNCNLFTVGEIKNIFMQLLHALDYCHMNSIIHRDIKIANLLIDKNGVLKLADFGLARFHSDVDSSNMTNRVITLWYRPPELLLGSEHYSSAVDMWSCGCVLAELITSNPLFSADNETDILKMIVTKIGFPTEKEMKYLRNLPHWNVLKFNPAHPSNMNNVNQNKKTEIEASIRNIPGIGELGLDLIKKLLKWQPCDRITASEALNHPWFKTNPIPEKIHQRNNIKAAHSFMTKSYKKRDTPQVNNRKIHENFRYINVGTYRKAFFGKYAERKLAPPIPPPGDSWTEKPGLPPREKEILDMKETNGKRNLGVKNEETYEDMKRDMKSISHNSHWDKGITKRGSNLFSDKREVVSKNGANGKLNKPSYNCDVRDDRKQSVSYYEDKREYISKQYERKYMDRGKKYNSKLTYYANDRSSRSCINRGRDERWDERRGMAEEYDKGRYSNNYRSVYYSGSYREKRSYLSGDGRSREGRSGERRSREGISREGISREGRSREGRSRERRSREGRSREGRSREAEWEAEREMEKERQREKEKELERERERQRERERKRERERQKEREGERERERQKERERERQKEKERGKVKNKENAKEQSKKGIDKGGERQNDEKDDESQKRGSADDTSGNGEKLRKHRRIAGDPEGEKKKKV
ncbi:cdc2-related protein kinase 3, putative (CRK3) [Plasmodium ovale wallikeri]|uniref:Cyclin-dependent kinase 2 homolog n=1 Tax=Plasmodium ovale wallikeri TaxID=864142 RepID=A0A1A8YN41_PLAOA|nr:cdc2-related protein kinase 3, putative (CRK3) [Plasmodium ovale wallikeri]